MCPVRLGDFCLIISLLYETLEGKMVAVIWVEMGMGMGTGFRTKRLFWTSQTWNMDSGSWIFDFEIFSELWGLLLPG
jgi:hypothetical protein